MYVTSFTALGMLGTLATALTIDAFGPVSDNAGGIAEMAQLPAEVMKYEIVLTLTLY